MRILIPGIVLFAVYTLFARWYFVCEIRNHCGEEEAETEVVDVRPSTLNFYDGDSLILEGYDQFLFGPDSLKPHLNENNRLFLSEVAGYLSSFPERKIQIQGNYLTAEARMPAGFFENIGLARAAQAELLLENLGVTESNIFLDHQMMPGDTLFEPLRFSLAPPDSSVYRPLQFSFKDMTYSNVNFAFNSDEFAPGEGFVNYADSLTIYLDENPDYRLLIIGHTDSIASRGYNEDLGLRRAISARSYLKELGITSEIEVLSKGESEPVAPNSWPDGSDNEAGREKNRRVNFKLESTLQDQ